MCAAGSAFGPRGGARRIRFRADLPKCAESVENLTPAIPAAGVQVEFADVRSGPTREPCKPSRLRLTVVKPFEVHAFFQSKPQLFEIAFQIGPQSGKEAERRIAGDPGLVRDAGRTGYTQSSALSLSTRVIEESTRRIGEVEVAPPTPCLGGGPAWARTRAVRGSRRSLCTPAHRNYTQAERESMKQGGRPSRAPDRASRAREWSGARSRSGNGTAGSPYKPSTSDRTREKSSASHYQDECRGAFRRWQFRPGKGRAPTRVMPAVASG
jgi:hypothetical protein